MGEGIWRLAEVSWRALERLGRGWLMSTVIVLSWDRVSRRLEYVEVNGGLGGVALAIEVPAESADIIAGDLAGLVLPRTADLEHDGDVVLLELSGGVPVARYTVNDTVGSPGARQFALKPKTPGVPAIKVGIARLGVSDRDAMTVRKLEYLYAQDLEPPGCWLGCEGGVDAWLAGKRREAEAEALEKETKRREAHADERFINPYTFVPFPVGVARRAPAGHHLLGEGRLSGTFTVTWVFTTPFQAPDGASGTTVLRLPGSSVKGAARSAHEALAGGCLRIFDEEFVPSYRDAAVVRKDDWTLAVVSKATGDGQPLEVRLCDDVVWARVGQLRKATGGRLRTGSLVTIADADVVDSTLGRKELAEKAVIGDGGDWVVLVTDAGTRTKLATYFLACGRLGSRTAEVTEGAWSTFRVAVAGTNDLRRKPREARQAAREEERRAEREADAGGPDEEERSFTEEKQPFAEVTFKQQPVGMRRVVTGWLWAGDVIWVKVAAGGGGPKTVSELSLAAIWRHPGWPDNAVKDGQRARWTAGNRVPDGERLPEDGPMPEGSLLACRDPDFLCVTCRVFGSADPDSRDRGDRADQRAYAGHVRFGDACSDGPVGLTGPIWRAPLGAPRPGAGQFYLDYSDTSPATGRDRRPTREWGSDPDTRMPRRLRGRKFYWHADPAAQSVPRHIAREHQRDKALAVERWIAPAGTQLSQRVSFDNLSEAELGGLLAAFEPQRVLGALAGGRRVLSHLGGGKPLGLGSCTATVSGLRAWNAASRYGGAPDIVPDDGGYVRAFTEDCPDAVKGTWPSLAAVLAEGTVDARRIWYPPGAYWPDQALDEQQFDEPFAFFKRSSGLFLKDKPAARSLVPLPVPGAGDQSLKIATKDDE